MSAPRAAVVGTGFIGVVHVEALRRLGVEVTGVVGSTPERARAKAAQAPLAPVYASFEEMLADDAVDVVHITTPNRLHHPQAKAALEAGKHVVCEKPLALDSRESGELVRLATARGLVNCTNFNLRFYPLCQQAYELCRNGSLGRIWNVHGSYLQDWLLLDTDWNWRLEPDVGGVLRAVADIGSHWLDLATWIAGARVESVLADLFTVHPTRLRPRGEIETFAGMGSEVGERDETPVSTEDGAHVLLRLEGGGRGAVVVSQVSAGRRNSLHLEVDGADGSLTWSSERHEELLLGRRDRPNEIMPRDPALLGPLARDANDYPGGHPSGFPDTFKQLYRRVYRAVEAGGPSSAPDYPTFADGHEEIVIGEAIARSARDGGWVDVLREERT